MKKLLKRLKMWIYWRKKYSTESIFCELGILFGLKKGPFSFRVMAPLEIFIDKMNDTRRINNG